MASNWIIKPCASRDLLPCEKVACRGFSLLEITKKLNNVSKAYTLIGYSRQIRTMGPGAGSTDGLVAKGGLDYSLARPTDGALGEAEELS